MHVFIVVFQMLLEVLADILELSLELVSVKLFKDISTLVIVVTLVECGSCQGYLLFQVRCMIAGHGIALSDLAS